MGIKKLKGSIEQKEEISEVKQNNVHFDEEEYYGGLSDVENEKKKGKDEKEQKIKGLQEKLFEDDDSQLLDKIDSSVFENVVNPDELKHICKKSIKNGMLEFDEDGKIINVYIEVGGEKRPSELFLSLIEAGFSSEQALKSRLQVRTESFKNWFGDWENSPQTSKIVDKNGEPLIMWHGTTRKLNEFSHNVQKNRVDQENTKDRFYFGTNFKLLKKNYADTKFETINELLNVAFDIARKKYNKVRIMDLIREYNEIVEEIFGDRNKLMLEDNGAIYYSGKNKNNIRGKRIIDPGLCSQASWMSLAEGRKPTLDDFEKGSYDYKVKGGKIRLNGIYLPKTGLNGYMLPFFVKGTNISEVNDVVYMDSGFDVAISNGNSDTDIISVQTGNNQYVGVKNASQIKSAVDNDGTFFNEEGKFNDYFGKKAKLTTGIDSKVVHENQSKINTILSSDKTLEEKSQELSEYISRQCFSIIGENLSLTKPQIESIIKSYYIKGTIGKLSFSKLRQKDKILSETIANPKIRRILLESGLC